MISFMAFSKIQVTTEKKTLLFRMSVTAFWSLTLNCRFAKKILKIIICLFDVCILYIFTVSSMPSVSFWVVSVYMTVCPSQLETFLKIDLSRVRVKSILIRNPGHKRTWISFQLFICCKTVFDKVKQETAK